MDSSEIETGVIGDKPATVPKQELDTMDYIAMDAADEQQVLEMMKGRVIEDWVYEVRGQYQLTLVGIEEAAFLYARKQGKGIDLSAPQYEFSTDGKEMRCWIKATDLITGASAIGAKADITDKPFYFEAIISKAERNAKRKLLPVSFLKAIIEAAISQGKVKRLTSTEGVRPKFAGSGKPTPSAQPRQASSAGFPNPGNLERPVYLKAALSWAFNHISYFSKSEDSDGKRIPPGNMIASWLRETAGISNPKWSTYLPEQLEHVWRTMKEKFPMAAEEEAGMVTFEPSGEPEEA